MLYFNAQHGFLEGLVRGLRVGLLNSQNYLNLTQCETLGNPCLSFALTRDDLKLQLSATEYGNFLANVPSPLSTSTISEKATEKLVEEFNYLRAQAVGDFAKFFDYITYSYQIDNVVLLITGTLHERDTRELLDRCHPLGWFNSLPALCVATTVEELYNSVLIETPLAPYFKECLSAAELDELNIEIIRNTLYKAYLEDFLHFCLKLPSPTDTIMQEILAFEADRRAINITVNSFGTDLSKDERAKLYPDMGRLYPNGTMALQRCDDVEGVKLACDNVVEYRPFFEQTSQGGAMQKSLEDHFFEREAQLNKLAFLQQFHFAIVYAFLKLREQEIRFDPYNEEPNDRNITWIAECIAMNQREKISNYISVF